MKIAIASEGKDEKSKISSRGGRAPYYLIFEDKNLVKVIKNPFATGGGGAGYSVAYMLENEKVDLVIAKKIGQNMKSALQERTIKFREKSGEGSIELNQAFSEDEDTVD